MTRKEMWEEFESQLKREVRTPITMSYDDSIRLAEMGIKDVVKRWKKRLEQEPCEDAISRQAVLDATVKRNSIWNKITNSKGENLEEIISQLPPVTPKGVTVTDFADRCRECGKMRKGHWIYDETIENWRCSKCNETPKTMGYVGTADFMAEHFKFCNHCGADMRGVKKARDKE